MEGALLRISLCYRTCEQRVEKQPIDLSVISTENCNKIG